MSWLRTNTIALIALAGLAPGLGGCGFHPLYGADPDRVSTAALESIDITPIPDRQGQIIYNFLRDELNPQGRPAQPRYILDVGLTNRTDELAVRSDQTATRIDLTIIATYKLHAIDSETPVLTGVSRSITSFNIVSSPYATMTSKEDAERRAGRQISEDIHNRIATYLLSASASTQP